MAGDLKVCCESAGTGWFSMTLIHDQGTDKLIVFDFSVLGLLAGACAWLVGTQRRFQRFVP